MSGFRGKEYDQLFGMKVFVSPHAQNIETRSWFERLFTWPWRPLQLTKMAPIAYTMSGPNGKFLIIHPDLLDRVVFLGKESIKID